MRNAALATLLKYLSFILILLNVWVCVLIHNHYFVIIILKYIFIF